MPPILAAGLTVGFILWLINRDRRTSPNMSAALWIALIWVGIAASKPVVCWLQTGTSVPDLNAALDGSPIDRYVTITLLLLGIGVLAKRGTDWASVSAANKSLCAFHLFALVSVLWADYSFVAFKRWIRDVGNIVVILVILSEKDPEAALHTVFIRCTYVLLPLSVLVNKYYLDIGAYFNYWTGQAYYRGITTDKNGLGRLAILSVLFLVWSIDRQQLSGWARKLRRKWPEALLLIMCVELLRKAESSTSVACIILGLLVYAVTRVRAISRNRGLLTFGAVSLLLGALLALGAADLRELVTTSLGRRPDLTDRSTTWSEAIALKTNPLIGVGFASFWTTADGIKLGEKLQVASAHNGYLETYLNTGLVGIVLLFGVMAAAGRNTLNALLAGRTAGSLYAALLMVGLIYNLSETAFNNTGIVGFVLWFLALRYQFRLTPSPIMVGNNLAQGR